MTSFYSLHFLSSFFLEFSSFRSCCLFHFLSSFFFESSSFRSCCSHHFVFDVGVCVSSMMCGCDGERILCETATMKFECDGPRVRDQVFFNFLSVLNEMQQQHYMTIVCLSDSDSVSVDALKNPHQLQLHIFPPFDSPPPPPHLI